MKTGSYALFTRGCSFTVFVFVRESEDVDAMSLTVSSSDKFVPVLYCIPSPCRPPPPPGRSATLQTFAPEDLQLCRPSPGRFATLQTFPQGRRVATSQIFPLSLQIFPGERSATLQTFPHFCKVPDSYFRMYRKRGFNHNQILYIQKL